MIPVCGCGGNGNGGGGGGCCSPSIAASSLCMPDGSPIAVLMSSPCADCEAASADPAVVGWVDLTSGAFTPGSPPGGAAPCTGDGGPGPAPCMPITSSGLCLPDGTPITVIITRDCDTGVVAETGWLNLLDGTFTAGPPPAGTAPCATTIDESPGEPCDETTPVTSLGLCLADGTPIGVTIERACDGSTTQVGWINLTTGTFTPGLPPAGTIACGESRSIQVSGVFCDILPDGSVAGLVLVEYQYNADGSIASVTLLDAATGQPYTLQGELSVCPTGTEPESPSEEPDVVPCADGNALLVKLCDDESPTEPPCRNTSTSLLCDIPTDGEPDVTVTDTDPTPYYDICPRCLSHCGNGTCRPVPNAAPLWAGGSVQFGPDPQGPTQTRRVHRVAAATIQADRPACDDGTATLTVSVRVTNDGPIAGWAGVGGLVVIDTDAHTQVGVVAAQPNAPVGYQDTLTVTAQVDAAKLAAGSYVADINLETYDSGSLTAPGQKAWTVDQFAADVVFDQAGCETQFRRTFVIDCETGQPIGPPVDTDLDGNPYTPTGEIGQCTTAGGECCPPEPCRNTSTLLVCDIPTDGTDPDPTVADTDPTVYAEASGRPDDYEPVTGGAASLWSGGTLSIPPDPSPPQTVSGQFLRAFAATVQAPRPACDDGTATVTATVRTERTGPDAGCNLTGAFQMYVGTTAVATARPTSYAPVGTVDILTVTAQVPAAELAAGNVALYGILETYQTAPVCPGTNPDGAAVGGWTVDEFAADVVFDQEDCAEQIFASVVTDCETGEVISVSYTTTDGQPYTPTGDIGQCTAAGGECCPPEPCRDSSTLLVCDIPTEGVTGELTATDTAAGPPAGTTQPAAYPPLPGGGAALWSGGTLVFPADPDASAGDLGQVYRGIAADLAATRPTCDDGTARVTVSVHVTNDGPGDGAGMSGTFWLIDAAGDPIHSDTLRAGNAPYPPGYERTLTVTGDVDAAALAAGDITVGLWLETFHGTPKQWTADQFTTSYEFGTAGCGTQVFANVVTDCETGEVLSVTYTTTDGQPYTPTGEIGQCTPAGGGDGTNPALTDCEDGPALRVTLCDSDESPSEADCVSTFTVCRCDMLDGSPGESPSDADVVSYTEVWCIPADGGAPTLIWTYADDPSVEYVPTNPVDCADLPSSPEVICESHVLCDSGDPAAGDQPVSFVRTVCRDVAGNVVSSEDYELDFETPYAVRSL